MSNRTFKTENHAGLDPIPRGIGRYFYARKQKPVKPREISLSKFVFQQPANPFPIIVPCHRAVRSDLTLGGFQGGLSMKRALLEAEGIGFDSSGRVAVDSFFLFVSLRRTW